MAGFYESWFRSPGFGPGWMHDPVGDAYWGAVGKAFDEQVERAKMGLRARFPEDAAALGMEDALEQIGRDRLLPRGGATPGAADEALADWAERLTNAPETWQLAGTAKGLLLELKVQGFPAGETGASIFTHNGRRYYLDDDDELVVTTPCMSCVNRMDLSGAVPSPPIAGFTLDARDSFYSHFCIMFLQSVEGLTNGDGNALKALLNQTVSRWRQGGAHYVGASICPVGDAAAVWGWPADLVWGQDDLTWGTNGALFIDPE